MYSYTYVSMLEIDLWGRKDIPMPIILAGSVGESYRMHCLTSSFK